MFAVILAGACLASAAPVEQKVVVVFKTHFDIGYTDLASNVVKRYRTTMIDEALKVVDQSRRLPPEQQFTWTLPGWPLSKIVEDWPGQAPERKQRVLTAFKEGRFVVHALPFTTHTELLEPEDLVRGLDFAARLSRTAGLELPRDAKMTDVPCHSWILPTLLRHAGVDFLHLGCNAASSSPEVPRLFWWEGPDGSRLLTMYTAESYGTGLVPPKDWPYKTWLALIHTGDNHGPPRPDEVKKLLDEARQKLPGVTVQIGRLSDFADGIVAEKEDLPVVRGDMPDTWIHGPMCDPGGAKIARNLRPSINVAETLGTQARGWGLDWTDAGPVIRRAYEQSLLYGEHTWGGALYWVTKYSGGAKWGYGDAWKADFEQKRFQRLEDSWAEHTAYIENARDLVQPLLERQLNQLAQAVDVPGKRIVVYNPLPWRRDGIVTVPAGGAAFDAVRPTDGGEAIPVANHDGTLTFTASLPASGYRTFVPAALKTKPSLPTTADLEKTIESPFFKAVLDPTRAAIRSLVDKRTGRELVDDSAPVGFGQYLYERFDSNIVAGFVDAYVKVKFDWAINELGKPNLPPASQVPYQALSPKNSALSLEQNPVATTAVMKSGATGGLPHATTTRLILYRNLPFADLELTLHDKPADPWPEAGWICLPFKIDQPQFRLGRQVSMVDPAKDVVRGANRHLFGIDTGVAVFDPQGRGVGLCPMDNPLVSLDSPGCWKYSRDFLPAKPHVYVNLFNNQWTTNFRYWNQGTWTFRVRLWSFEKFGAPALAIPALEARYPLQGAVADGAAGKLPATERGLELSRPGAMVTAYGANADGSGTTLRVWDYAANSGACKISLPKGTNYRLAQPVNLRGQPSGSPIAIDNGSFQIDLRPFAPASFVLR